MKLKSWMVVDWLYLVVKQIQMTTPPPPFLALVALYFSSCNAVLHISCAIQEPLQIQLQQQMQIQESKASQKTVVQMATPSPPASLPNWPTYCIVSSTTPHQAIDALGMPSRPSTIHTIYAKYLYRRTVFFYKIP